jgi:hypothetical protein
MNGPFIIVFPDERSIHPGTVSAKQDDPVVPLLSLDLAD